MTLRPEQALNAALRSELHSVAQPLSILQCRLELASMTGQEQDMRDAVGGALADLRTITEGLNRLRAIVSALASVEVQ